MIVRLLAALLALLGAAPHGAAPTPRAETVWDRLADCETGQWIDGGTSFVPFSGRWDAEPTASSPFYGGLQFTSETWTSFGGSAYSPDAAHATRAQQIAVATKVQRVQGWSAWPTCSRMTGIV